MIEGLATEVLFKIFEFTCISSIPIFEDPEPLYMPEILTRVSRRWQDLAINHAVLWTEIHLSQYDTRGLHSFNINDLEAALSHSKKHPLHIHLDFAHVYSQHTPAEYVEVVRAIRQHLKRCWRLTISGDAEYYWILYRELKYCPTPLVEQLELRCGVSDPCIPAVPITFEPQRLAHLYVDGLLIYVAFDASFRAAKIMTIRNAIFNYDRNNVHRSAVETLLLSNFSYDVSNTEPMDLPFLKYLKLDGPQDANIFLNSTCKADSLTHLEMSRFLPHIWDEINRRVGECRWFQAVERLTLSYFEIDSQYLTSGFTHIFPRLELLDFVHADPTPLLKIVKADRTLWPGLKISVDCKEVAREL